MNGWRACFTRDIFVLLVAQLLLLRTYTISVCPFFIRQALHDWVKFYKLYACTYVASMMALYKAIIPIQARYKFVNLFDLILSSIRGKCHHVPCDSIYIGDIMALIDWNMWKINMVGTIQSNQTGALMAASMRGHNTTKKRKI